MSAMGYTALNIGHTDFTFGDEFILSAPRDFSVPVLSSNLVDNETGAALAPEHMILTYGSFTVGIIGIVAQKYQQAITKFNEGGIHAIGVHDETEKLRQKVAELEGETDVIIALSDTGLEKGVQLAEDVPGIHVIICSGGYDKTRSPIVKNGVYIVEAGSSGECIGKLTLRLDENGRILSGEGSIITLAENVPEGSAVAAIIDSYRKGLKEYADELIVVEQKDPEQGWYYIGAVACAQCHVAQSGQWRGTGHSKAFTALTERSQDLLMATEKCTNFGI